MAGRATGDSDFHWLAFGMAATVAFSLIVQVGEQVDFLRFLPEKTKENRVRWWTAVLVAGPGWIVPGMAKMLGGAFLAFLVLQQQIPTDKAVEPTQMYQAGFGYLFSDPRAVLAITLCALVWWRYRNEDLRHVTRASGREILRALAIALPAIALPFVIRYAVVEGIATATEVSTIGIVYAFIVGFFIYGLLIYRNFDWRRLLPMLIETASLSGAILLIIPGFITSAIGLFLLFPPTRWLVKLTAITLFASKFKVAATTASWGNRGYGYYRASRKTDGSYDIDGEAVDVTDRPDGEPLPQLPSEAESVEDQVNRNP